MVIKIKKGSSKDSIEKALNQLNKIKKSGFNPWKYHGKTLFKNNGLELQRELRKEW